MIVLLNLSLMAIFLFVVSLCMVLWVASLSRLYNGQPILNPEPRVVPQVGLGELLLGFGVMVLVSTLFAPLVLPANENPPANENDAVQEARTGVQAIAATDVNTDAVSDAEVETDAEAEVAGDVKAEVEGGADSSSKAEQPSDADAPSLDRTIGLIVLNSIATVLAVLVVLMWLRLQGVSLSAAGFLPTFRHIAIGVAGAVMILPPVMVLQAILASQIAYEHPLLEVLQNQITVPVMIAMAISASIVAPLVEEFYFRGLMQGWLEKLSVAFGSGKNTVGQVMEFPTVSQRNDGSADLPQLMPEGRRASWPGIITSFMFALVHAGQGPAPFSLFFLALGIAYLYKQTGSIWPGIVVHFVLNATATSVMIVSSLLAAA